MRGSCFGKGWSNIADLFGKSADPNKPSWKPCAAIMLRRAAEPRPSRLYVFHVRPARNIFSSALNFRSPQWWPWSARRDGLVHSACQEDRRYRLRGRWNELPRHVTVSSEHHFEIGYGPSETTVVARPIRQPQGPAGRQSETMLCGRRSETITCGRLISESGGPPFEWKVRTNGRPNNKRDCRIRDPWALVGPVTRFASALKAR